MKVRWLLVVALLSGCMTLPGARPLAPGQHAVGLSVGGPIVDIGPTIPMPNAVLEGRSGLTRIAERPLDLNYGLNLTPIPYGVIQAHVGASWLLLHEVGWWPSLSITNRVFFAANPLGRKTDAEDTFGVWGLDQLELAIAHDIGSHFMWWVSLAEYLDFADPDLLLAPALGIWFDPGADGGLGFGLETRWYGFNRRPPVDTVKWKPGPQGAIGLGLMVAYVF